MLRALILLAALTLNAASAAAAPEQEKTALLSAVVDGGKSVMVVTRARQGRLREAAAAPALSVEAFSIALGRTFGPEGGPLAAHAKPWPLPQSGPLAGGFVAAVDGFGGRCGFAIGGLDFSGKSGAEGLDAAAALIFCAQDAAALRRISAPEEIAAKLAKLPPG
mgnify:CR=1 FL=1